MARRHRNAPDPGPGAGLAVLVGLIQIIGSRGAGQGHPELNLDGVGYALLLAGPVALLARRRAPLAVLIVAAAATLAYSQVAEYPKGPYMLAAAIALFNAVRAQRYEAVLVAGLGWLGYVLIGRVFDSIGGVSVRETSVTQAVLLALGILALMMVGEGARLRSEQLAQIAKTRAEQERAQAEQRRLRASEERLRIARELHDVLGHHLSLINVQAGVGLHLMDSQPQQARESLAAIKQASAEALREVRAVLAALGEHDEAAPRAPAPSLSRLTDLVADIEAAGLPVHVETQGPSRPLPAEVDRAAYRIVQEALTNVRRHAGPEARASVTIRYAGDAVIVRIENEGAADPVPPDGDDRGGAGLPGMRERVAALGGTFSAGPRSGGGFLVEARLPHEEVS